MNWAKTVGFIVFGYIVFTTVKGNLRRWLQIIGLKPDDSPAQTMNRKVGLRGLRN